MDTEKTRQDRCINYFEFNVADIAQSWDFYGKAFGWTFTDYGLNFCEFSDGHMKGGVDANGPVTPCGPMVVLYGSDLTENLGRIEAAGGRRKALTMSRRTRGFPPARPMARRIACAISMGHYQRDLVSLAMCGRLPVGRGIRDSDAILVGAAMCPAC